MALSDVIQLRYAAVLPQLTNGGTLSAGGTVAVNTTQLAEAIKSAKAQFFDQVGLDLDDTTPDESHLLYGCKLTIYYLKEFRGQLTAEDKIDWEKLQKELYGKSKKRGGGSAYVSPVTNSNLVPSRERTGERPFSDPENFVDVTPRAPSRTNNPLAPFEDD